MKKINRDYFYNEHLISEKPLFIEVGLWTIENLTYLNKQHPNSRLRAYEADPDNYKILVKNNNLPNLKTYHKAVGWETGKMQFYKYEFPAWHSMYPKHTIDMRKKVATIEVDAVSINDIIQEPVDLLILNCEGCEIAVMNSLIRSESLRNNINQMCTSFHEGKCYDKQVKENYLTLLRKYYHVFTNTDNVVHYYLFIRK